MPTFIFLKNGQQPVAQVQGADMQQVEAIVKQHGGAEGASESKDGMVNNIHLVIQDITVRWNLLLLL